MPNVALTPCSNYSYVLAVLNAKIGLIYLNLDLSLLDISLQVIQLEIKQIIFYSKIHIGIIWTMLFLVKYYIYPDKFCCIDDTLSWHIHVNICYANTLPDSK